MRSASHAPWGPTLGAWLEPDGTHFRVWVPAHRRVEVVVETRLRQGRALPLQRQADGSFVGVFAEVAAGDLYRYRLDGTGPYPDPASRRQPEGVHGPSQVVDPSSFRWSDARWGGVPHGQLVVYELHVGTFTRAGTFAGIIDRLSFLKDLGVSAIELMPLADFAGTRNWGYDGVALFAPARCYGSPDDLRRLVDAAHGAGLGVILDVVYNHLGPDGAYLGTFSPYYFSTRHRTPWGAAMNLDGTHSDMVREFLIENALSWLHEYHFDGLRLDATHALVDEGPRHFLAELSDSVRGWFPAPDEPETARRRVWLIAEDHRNLSHMLRPTSAGGWGMDAVWADDFHHQIRRGLAGDREGYYADFSGSTADLATTAQRGWFFCGQHSTHLGGPRGTDSGGIDLWRFVICLQNHDQIGNRALGERLHHQIDAAAYRAATVLLLCLPETPLLFMGQEWAASAPFLYFTDHHADLGRLVTEGRRKEFASFAAFSNPQARESIPDPQAVETFRASQLDWTEPGREPHASVHRLYRELLALRQHYADWITVAGDGFSTTARGADAVRLNYASGGSPLLVVVQLRGNGCVEIGDMALPEAVRTKTSPWNILLHTEETRFTLDPRPVRIVPTATGVVVEFARPGAALFTVRAA